MTFSLEGYMSTNNLIPFKSVQEVINAVERKNPLGKKVLYELLKREVYGQIHSYIVKNQGNQADVEDKFHDGMIAVYHGIERNKLTLSKFSRKSHTDQLCAYLMRIVKNLWLKELRWRSRPPLEIGEKAWQVDEDSLAAVVAEVFSSLGGNCQGLMKSFFLHKTSYLRIAKALGPAHSSASVKKSMEGCIGKLFQHIRAFASPVQNQELGSILASTISGLEGGCKTLLTSFYFQKMSMEEIAQKMSYASAHSAREQKRKCMKKLNLAVAEKLVTQDNQKIPWK